MYDHVSDSSKSFQKFYLNKFLFDGFVAKTKFCSVSSCCLTFEKRCYDKKAQFLQLIH